MQILSKLFLPMGPVLTNLERLVASRAIGTAFVTNIYSEFKLDRILFDCISNIHSNQSAIISVLIIYLYCQLRIMEGNEDKMKNINIYNKYNRLIRELLFIVFLVFTRDTQSAT